MNAELAKVFDLLETEMAADSGRFLSAEERGDANVLPSNEKRAVYFEAILRTLQADQARVDEEERLKVEEQRQKEAEARLAPRGADKVAAAIAHVKGKAVEG